MEKEGEKEEGHNINLEVSKVFHRFPERNEEHLRLKFGNGWKDRVQDLLDKRVLVEDGECVRLSPHFRGYLI